MDEDGNGFMTLKKGKSLCISSAKGGVGKTITALNIAGCAEALDKKVLLVDFDLYSGGVAASLNVNYQTNLFTLYTDINSGAYKKLDDYTVKYSKNIDILACPKDPRQANKIDSKFVEQVIEKSTNYYDFVIIDTNHIINEHNLLIMSLADMVLFLVTNDLIDLKNMRSLVNVFNNAEFTKYKVLLNNSRDPFKEYFSVFNIKSIIKSNIDYTLSKEAFLKNIDNYLMNGKIPTLEKKYSKLFTKDYSTMMMIIADLFKGEVINHD